MKRIKELNLSEADRLKLEKGYHNGPTHNYRIRCKSILLKSSGKSASQIAEMLDVTIPTIYAWIRRYEESVRKAIEEDRQSVSKAREAWEKASGKKASDITFKRFLEALVQDISE